MRAGIRINKFRPVEKKLISGEIMSTYKELEMLYNCIKVR